MSKKRLHYAQIQALRWLQGRVEDQLVRSHISTEIALLERIGYPINSGGTELTFPKREKTVKVSPNQLDLEEELRKKEQNQ